jgi:hypothetical protein
MAAASATTTTTTTVVEARDDRQPEVLYCKEGIKKQGSNKQGTTSTTTTRSRSRRWERNHQLPVRSLLLFTTTLERRQEESRE